eukprot:2991123-Pleurochrysis_carterae.AAC.3
MDGPVIPHRPQNNKCVQHFKAICTDRVSKSVKVTKTLHTQRLMMWMSAALFFLQGTAVQYCDVHSTGRSAMSPYQVDAVQ